MLLVVSTQPSYYIGMSEVGLHIDLSHLNRKPVQQVSDVAHQLWEVGTSLVFWHGKLSRPLPILAH